MLVDNRKEDIIARGYNCIEKVPYLTEFLPTKNTTVEITRLEALFCISIGSHCCIKNAFII